ncbi:hypothetical protein DYD21_19720 [Rhodohalobacter sp. SW132]|nr:hypothetical protein DYD21_19720 [Rhodohalobacter sp. SW132]
MGLETNRLIVSQGFKDTDPDMSPTRDMKRVAHQMHYFISILSKTFRKFIKYLRFCSFGIDIFIDRKSIPCFFTQSYEDEFADSRRFSVHICAFLRYTQL